MLKNNISNENKSKNIEDLKKKTVPLLYYFKNNTTSQDPLYPLNNLLNKNNKVGWLSNRFCTYPQEIIVEFHSYVNIKQINILINETKIPIMIEFINCIYIPNNSKEKGINSKRNNKINYEYKNIGFIKLSSNIETNYKARELRKVYVNILTKRIKLLIHRNYPNSINTFCQVGIISLNFYGYILNNSKFTENDINKDLNYLYLDEEIDGIDDSFFKDKMDKKSEEKLKELLEEMEKKKKCEEYDNCKIIKNEIDQLKKLTFKIYNLEVYKKECVERNDFDNAKKIKKDLDIFKKILNGYLNKTKTNENSTTRNDGIINNLSTNDEEKIVIKSYNNINRNSSFNYSENNIKNAKLQLTKRYKASKSQQDISYNNDLNYDNIILPTLQKKMNNNLNNISAINQSNSFDYNNSINTSGHFDSFNGMNENEQIEKEPLEDLSPETKDNYEILINLIGEEIIQKIFSKYIYYKEEGFDLLISKVRNIIIDSKKTTPETNKYIVLLINIFFNFLDEKHPSIVTKCLDLFIKILKSIEERSNSNKTEYDFKITKRILNKIKTKLNHISKRVRLKASELYCYMLDTNFCDYSTLIIELVENDVNEYFNKLGILNNNNYNFQMTSRGIIGIGSASNLKPEISKQLIITKMNIFLEIFKKLEKGKENIKIDIKKFPQNIVGDFIIININHPKEEVRDITKEVLVKYIHIFGNQILLKLKMFIENKELIKLFQDKEELKKELLIVEEEEKKKNNSNTKRNIFNINKSQKLNPIGIKSHNNNNNLLMNSNNKILNKSSSQPKYLISNKIKLKPINKSNSSLSITQNIIKNKKKIINNKDIIKNQPEKIEVKK